MPPNDLKKLNAALDREKEKARRSPSKPDPKTKEEDQDLQNQKTKSVVRSRNQNIKERKKYARLFFLLACCWVAMISLVVVLDGWKLFGFWLPEKIVLALIGSTTVDILGILYVVAHYLFPQR
jgi:hypothetical protein